MVLCRPEKEALAEKFLLTLPSLVISLLAVGIAITSYPYSRGKDVRARLHSVKDDYWFRKIASPVSVEPFVELSNEIERKLPDGSYMKVDVDNFYKTKHSALLDLRPGFQTLKLLDVTTALEAETFLESFEDSLAEYCHALGAYLSTGTQLPDRPAAIREMSNCRLKLLLRIQRHQADLGTF